jgi:hypothetical protein
MSLARLLAAVTLLALPRAAQAADDGDDVYEESPLLREQLVLDADGPPEQPGLSHRDFAFNFEYTVASAEPTDVVSDAPIQDQRAFAYAARWLGEYPIVPRFWFAGATADVAAASVPSSSAEGTGGSTLVLGNPELWGRGLWASRSGLGAGGGLGIVLPVPRTFSTLESEVVRAIRVVRPWDASHFQDMTITVRPFFDVRHVTGPVTLQMRQGVDVGVLLRDRSEAENRYDLTALGSLYVGVRTIRQLTLGMAVHETYQITRDLTSPSCISPCDQNRATVTLSPSIRLRLQRLSPSISVLLPLSTPLRAEVASYFAARLHLNFGL